jgi:DNA-directed RNA polymerase specialized sigma24 family protein
VKGWADWERTDKLLAMILAHDMKDAPQEEKVSALHIAGFGNADIAELLGMSAGAVAQHLYMRRTSGKKKAKKARR